MVIYALRISGASLARGPPPTGSPCAREGHIPRRNMAKRRAEFARNFAGIRLIPFAGFALMGPYAMSVPNAKEMNMKQTNDATNDLRRLPARTLVVSTLDGEPGQIVGPATFNRSHTKTTSHVVLTNDGLEIWEVADIILPPKD